MVCAVLPLVSRSLHGLRNITHLDLSDNTLVPTPIRPRERILKRCSCCRALCVQGKQAGLVLAEMLTHNQGHLRSLNLGDTGLQEVNLRGMALI